MCICLSYMHYCSPQIQRVTQTVNVSAASIKAVQLQFDGGVILFKQLLGSYTVRC